LDHFSPVQPGGGLGKIDLFFDGIPQGLDHFNVDIGLEERAGDFAEEGVENVIVHDLGREGGREGGKGRVGGVV
jgi:hypothetical protein